MKPRKNMVFNNRKQVPKPGPKKSLRLSTAGTMFSTPLSSQIAFATTSIDIPKCVLEQHYNSFAQFRMYKFWTESYLRTTLQGFCNISDMSDFSSTLFSNNTTTLLLDFAYTRFGKDVSFAQHYKVLATIRE